MSGKNAETFSLIRFGVFIESPKRFFKSPKPSGNPAGIVRSILRVGIFDYFCKDNRNLNHAATGHKELFSSCKLTDGNTGPDYNKTGVCI